MVATRPAHLQGDVDVAWNGRTYLVVGEETPSAGGATRIFGARVSTRGKVLDPGGVLLSLSGDSHANPMVTAGAGRFLVAWEERPEGTYTDLGAALVAGDGTVPRRSILSATDNNQANPEAAWLGDLFVVTWEDEPDAFDKDIFAARVLRNGVTLDGSSADACLGGDDPGLRVSVQPEIDQRAPAVTEVDGEAFVAWEEYDAPTPPDLGGNALVVNGERYVDEGFPVIAADGAQRDPVVATSAHRVLLAWADARSGTPSDLYLRVIDWDTVDFFIGPPPTTPGAVLSDAAGDQTEPSTAQRGAGFLVTWTDTRSGDADVVAARIGRFGEVLDPDGVEVAGGPQDERGSAVASGGGVHLVAYQRNVPAAPYGGLDRVFLRLVR